MKEVGTLVTVTISMLCLICLIIFKKYFPKSALSWELYIYIYGEGFILPLQLNYICFSIYMFVHIITVSVLLCLFMLNNIIVCYTSSRYSVLYFSCTWVILPLCHCYMCVCIHVFVNVITMVTAIFQGTSYDLLLGWATSWESCRAYFLYIICYSIVVILIDLHSKKWINISLFE